MTGPFGLPSGVHGGEHHVFQADVEHEGRVGPSPGRACRRRSTSGTACSAGRSCEVQDFEVVPDERVAPILILRIALAGTGRPRPWP